MFKRCSQESWAVTCPGPMRNLINATAEGKAVINPEIQALEVFWKKSQYMLTLLSVRKMNYKESTGMSMFSSSCKAHLQDPSWVPVGMGTSLMALGLKHKRCRTFL